MVLTKTFTLCLVLTALIHQTNVSASKHHVHKKVYVHEHKCKEDKGEAAGLIKKAVLSGDYKAISEIFQMYCGEANLAKGFDFTGSEELLKPTKDRLNDPDIVSFKGLAYHSLKTKEYERLSNIFLHALYGDYLLTLDEESSCVCTEKIVGQEAEVIDDEKHYKPEHKANVYSSDGYKSKWEVDASVATAKDDKKYNSVPCHWSAKIQVTCKGTTEKVVRALTEEELKIKRKDLSVDFSDESFMKSIVDNSYFSDLVSYTYSHSNYGRRKLAERGLLLAAAKTVNSCVCYSCDPGQTCCRELSDCADSESFCPA